MIKNGRDVEPKSGLDTQADVDVVKVVKIAEISGFESLPTVLWLLLAIWMSCSAQVKLIRRYTGALAAAAGFAVVMMANTNQHFQIRKRRRS